MHSTIALVTGANRGIGRSLTEILLKKDVYVIATSTTSEQALALEEDLGKFYNDQITGLKLDVRDTEEVFALSDQITKKFGRLDILVNNAGIIDKQGSSVETQKVEDWDNIISVNLRGPFLLTKSMLPLLKASKRGRVINIAGMLGTFSSKMEGGGHPAYRISKAGLNALTLILSQELHSDGILVNSIDPGWVRTDLGGNEAPRSPEEAASDIVQAIFSEDHTTGTLLRFGKPSDW